MIFQHSLPTSLIFYIYKETQANRGFISTQSSIITTEVGRNVINRAMILRTPARE